MSIKLVVVSEERIDVALELIDRRGYLSKRKPYSIEIREGKEHMVEALLFRGRIEYEVWEVEPRGTLKQVEPRKASCLTEDILTLPDVPKSIPRRRRTNAELIQDGQMPGTFRKVKNK